MPKWHRPHVAGEPRCTIQAGQHLFRARIESRYSRTETGWMAIWCDWRTRTRLHADTRLSYRRVEVALVLSNTLDDVDDAHSRI